MKVVDAGHMQWGGSLTAHRSGRMSHKILFEGEEGSPDNYLLVLANEGSDYYSPRHRHAWDQVRFCLEGSIPIGRDLKVDAGEIGYFPEGVHYGPQEGGPDRIVLLLQIGGASGLGYLSAAQLEEGRRRLLEEGVFEEGVFRRSSGEGKHNEDGYEAIWRVMTGRPLAYPKARYRSPIVMRPDGFVWREMPGMPGVRLKILGAFAERGLSLELVSIAPGSTYVVPPAGSLRFLFVRTGEGECGSEPFQSSTAVRLALGEAASIRANTPTEILAISVSSLGS
ncbi:MAG TPA: hypothetical protein VGI35_08005 [Steroidobacteraceae bacterium]